MSAHRLTISASKLLIAIVAIGIMTSLTGCGLKSWIENDFKVGPRYLMPAAPVAQQWIDYRNPQVSNEIVDLHQWWSVFGDPVLDILIDDASRQNLTLRIAGIRIAEARAELGFARGNMFPQSQEISASYSRMKTPSPGSDFFSQWSTDASLSWELDFWGRFRHAVDSAGAELDASVNAYNEVLVILYSDVATHYVTYRTFEERLAFARQNVEMQEASYALAQTRFDDGATSQADVQQARQVLEQTRAMIPTLETGQRQANNALCTLLGMSPEDFRSRLGSNAKIPVTPDSIVIGIPADLLRRRPDIRRAERMAAAQCARIGIATADLYPQISLAGSLGAQSGDLTQLFDFPSSMAAGLTPSLRWPILHYFRLTNNVEVQQARFDALLLTYQEKVLQAGREAEDAIYAFTQSQTRAANIAESADAADKALRIVVDQYREGAAEYTSVYLLQSTVAQQQDELASARGDIALNLINTYRALGGGWPSTPNQARSETAISAIDLSSATSFQ